MKPTLFVHVVTTVQVRAEPLLLEAFGPCLPRAEALNTFLVKVMDKPEGIKAIKNYFLGLT